MAAPEKAEPLWLTEELYNKLQPLAQEAKELGVDFLKWDGMLIDIINILFTPVPDNDEVRPELYSAMELKSIIQEMLPDVSVSEINTAMKLLHFTITHVNRLPVWGVYEKQYIY
jgi:hypothetical protein